MSKHSFHMVYAVHKQALVMDDFGFLVPIRWDDANRFLAQLH